SAYVSSMRRSVSAWRAPVSQCSHGKGDGHRETSRQREALVNRVQEIYLHIDMDAMDPEVAPGVVDHPVPGASLYHRCWRSFAPSVGASALGQLAQRHMLPSTTF